MAYAKLDGYDYDIITNHEGRVTAVDIFVDANNAIEIADISSDITQNDNRIYVEGFYLLKKSALVADKVFKIAVTEIRRRE